MYPIADDLPHDENVTFDHLTGMAHMTISMTTYSVGVFLIYFQRGLLRPDSEDLLANKSIRIPFPL
jgi:hypothetical protein